MSPKANVIYATDVEASVVDELSPMGVASLPIGLANLLSSSKMELAEISQIRREGT